VTSATKRCFALRANLDPIPLRLDPVGAGFPSLVGCNGDECKIDLGAFLKWWASPTTMGFPTKNDHFGVEIGGTTI